MRVSHSPDGREAALGPLRAHKVKHKDRIGHANFCVLFGTLFWDSFGSEPLGTPFFKVSRTKSFFLVFAKILKGTPILAASLAPSGGAFYASWPRGSFDFQKIKKVVILLVLQRSLRTRQCWRPPRHPLSGTFYSLVCSFRQRGIWVRLMSQK